MENNESIVAPVPRTHPKGTWLKMTYFDAYGFNGRDLHPSEADVGFFGLAEKASVVICDDEGCLVSRDEDAPDGTEVPGDLSYVCYTVRAPSGRALELMDHEVEVVSFGLKA